MDTITSAPGAARNAASAAASAAQAGADAVASGVGDGPAAVGETARQVTETVVQYSAPVAARIWSSTEGAREGAGLAGVAALDTVAVTAQTLSAAWTDAWAIVGCAAFEVEGNCAEGAVIGYAIGFTTSSPLWSGAQLLSLGATAIRSSMDDDAPSPAFNPGAFPEVNYQTVRLWIRAVDDWRWVKRKLGNQ